MLQVNPTSGFVEFNYLTQSEWVRESAGQCAILELSMEDNYDG